MCCILSPKSPFTHAIFHADFWCDFEYKTRRTLPCTNAFFAKHRVDWKESYHILFEDTLFPISANLAVFRRSVTRLKTRAGAGFVRKMASKSHEKSPVQTGLKEHLTYSTRSGILDSDLSDFLPFTKTENVRYVSQSNTKRGCVSVSPDLVTWLTSPWQWSSCRARVSRGRAWVSAFCLMLCVLTSADFQSQGGTEHLVADAFVWHVRLLRGIRFLRKFTGGRANRRPRDQVHSLLLEHMQEASTSRDEVMMSNHINLFVCGSSMLDLVRPQGLGYWPTGGSII